jgi:hypothetical protein
MTFFLKNDFAVYESYCPEFTTSFEGKLSICHRKDSEAFCSKCLCLALHVLLLFPSLVCICSLFWFTQTRAHTHTHTHTHTLLKAYYNEIAFTRHEIDVSKS